MTREEVIETLNPKYDQKTGWELEDAFDKLLDAFVLIQSQRDNVTGDYTLSTYEKVLARRESDDAKVLALLTSERMLKMSETKDETGCQSCAKNYHGVHSGDCLTHARSRPEPVKHFRDIPEHEHTASLYVYCLDCQTFGINLPTRFIDAAECGNCQSIHTNKYYPSCCIVADRITGSRGTE